mmetsp:Transcript_13444/g.19635  ORF Transcript_13444/g.19635 Transcript_13444/m.19635 type:complete len:237 (-) Transcript_13444:9-719(-)
MGQQFSKLCCECFYYSPEPMFELKETMLEGWNPHILNESLEFAKEEVLQHLNTPEDQFQELLNKDGYKVLVKEAQGGHAFLSEFSLPFKAQDILDFLRNTQERQTWDKYIQEIEQVFVHSNIEVVYARIKKILLVSSRDALVANKLTQLEKGLLYVSKSIEHPKYPEKADAVRARLEASGYFLEEVPGKTLTNVHFYARGSFGGSFPESMIKKLAGKAIPKYMSLFTKSLSNRLSS